MNILLLEDEENLNRGISLKLRKEGFCVFACAGAKEGRLLFLNHPIELVICDITLKDGDGLSFCSEIRKTSNVHFMFLTALDQEMDLVLGYEAGADDYMTKPFSLAVLVSKVHAIAKRIENKNEKSGQVITSGEVVFAKDEMKVFVKGEERELTKTELKLLKLFLEYPKQILSKGQIAESFTEMGAEGIEENTIAVNIRRLREKIEPDPANPSYIKNVRGLGYVWEKDCN